VGFGGWGGEQGGGGGEALKFETGQNDLCNAANSSGTLPKELGNTTFVLKRDHDPIGPEVNLSDE